MWQTIKTYYYYLLPIIKYIYANWYRYWQKLLTIIGDIKVFPKYPLFLIYNPEEYDYKIRGNDIRKLSNIIKPGDIILRKYDHYLDSYLIPGPYSHSGIYIGDNKIIHAVAEGVKEIDIIDFCQCDGIKVLRATELKDEEINNIILKAKGALGSVYDFKFNSSDSSAFYCHELTSYCFNNYIKFIPEPVTFKGKELKFIKPKYTADSFIKSDKLVPVYFI